MYSYVLTCILYQIRIKFANEKQPSYRNSRTVYHGARSGNRTRTTVRPRNFKSRVSTYSTIRAFLEAPTGLEPVYTVLQTVA